MKVKILIADDYKDNRSLLIQIASLLNYEYVSVENGREAIQALTKHDDINMVFMDIEMPVMNGIEATKEIRKLYSAHSKVPVVAITAHTTDLFESKLQSAGFNDFITKPYTLDKIQTVVEKYLK